MIAFIDDHRATHRVEPICRVLPIAPSTYHAHVAQRLDASKQSAWTGLDAALRPEVARVFAENFEGYGTRKVWRQMARGLRRRPLHRRATYAGYGPTRRDPRQADPDDRSRQDGAMPARPGEPGLSCTGAEPALALGLNLRQHLVRLRLCGLRHRCLRPQDRRLASEQNSTCQFRPRRSRAGFA